MTHTDRLRRALRAYDLAGPETPERANAVAAVLSAAHRVCDAQQETGEQWARSRLDLITTACLAYATAARARWECSENDGFAVEMAYQYGAGALDDDCELLVITTENMINLMAALGFEHRSPTGRYCPACRPHRTQNNDR